MSPLYVFNHLYEYHKCDISPLHIVVIPRNDKLRIIPEDALSKSQYSSRLNAEPWSLDFAIDVVYETPVALSCLGDRDVFPVSIAPRYLLIHTPPLWFNPTAISAL